MICRTSVKVKYLFGQGVKDIWSWMVTLENKKGGDATERVKCQKPLPHFPG